MIKLTDLLKKWLETSTLRQKLTAALLAFSLLATGVLLTLGRSSGTSSDTLGSTPFYFLGVFVKLVGVLLLVVASSVLFRRWANLGPKGSRVRHLHLLETVRLSPKQALHLVAIGDQQILIGATDQSIALITPVTSSLDITLVEAPQPQSGLDFASLLQTLNIRVPTNPLKGKE
jgi:flagellar biosynthetic protein FliO